MRGTVEDFSGFAYLQHFCGSQLSHSWNEQPIAISFYEVRFVNGVLLFLNKINTRSVAEFEHYVNNEGTCLDAR